MNKNLLKMAKAHADHLVDDIKKSDGKMRREVLEERAEEIYRAIEKEIGTNDGLFYMTHEKDRFITVSSALMGVFSRVLAVNDESEDIYNVINVEIGKKKWLYNYGKTEYGNKLMAKATSSNASMVILSKMLGKDEGAEKIYKRIGRMIGTEDCLYRDSRSSESNHLGPNALMGIAAKLLGKDDDAQTLYEKITERFEKSTGLYDDGWGMETYGNASMAVFLKLMGKENEAEKIAENLEEHMLNGTLFSEDKALGDPVTHSNALMGIYYCLKAGKKLTLAL